MHQHAGEDHDVLVNQIVGNQRRNLGTERSGNGAYVVIVHHDAACQVTTGRLKAVFKTIGCDADRESASDANIVVVQFKLNHNTSTTESLRTTEFQGARDGHVCDLLVVVVGFHNGDVTKTVVHAGDVFNQHMRA